MPMMKFTGIEGVIMNLRNIAQVVPDKARKTMHRAADRIVKEAQLNTPVDTHDLEESIHKEITHEGAAGRQRLQIDIVAGRGIDYALDIHENYESRMPGKGTIAKREANPGRYIGSKFLERAIDKEKQKLSGDMIEATREGIREA